MDAKASLQLAINTAVSGLNSVNALIKAIRDLGGDSAKAEQEAQRLADELQHLTQQQRLIDTFRQLSEGVQKADAAFQESQANAQQWALRYKQAQSNVEAVENALRNAQRELGKTFDAAGIKTLKSDIADLERELKAAQKEANQYGKEFDKARGQTRALGDAAQTQQVALQKLRGEMDRAGVSWRNIELAEAKVRKGMRDTQDSIAALGESLKTEATQAKTAKEANEALRKSLEAAGQAAREVFGKEMADAGNALGKFHGEFQQLLKDLGKTDQGVTEFYGLAAAIQKSETAIEQLDDATRSLYRGFEAGRDVARARDILGLGDSTAIRAEVEKVKQSFDTLRASGKLSFGELAQAQIKAAEKIHLLRDETGGYLSVLSRMQGALLEAGIAGAGLVAVARQAIEFESAMAKVAKTTDLSADQIGSLGGRLQDLSREIPISASGLADIAAAGGQLGIASNQIEGFVRLAAQMSTAFDIPVEATGEAVAKLINNFKLSIDQTRLLGDAINTLGNNTAAKESAIVDALARIAGGATQFGLGAEQAAALATAMLSLGTPTETVGTAINAMLSKLQTARQGTKSFHEGLNALGLDAERVAKSIQANPQKALSDFLHTLEGLSGQARSEVLVKLFGLEYQDDVGRLVNALGEYDKALARVADRSKYAGSMDKEFQTRLETTEKQLQLTLNALNNVAVNLGTVFLPAIREAAQGIGKGADALAGFAKKFPEIAGLATTLLSAALAAQSLRVALLFLGGVGAKAFDFVTTSLPHLTTEAGAATKAIGRLQTAMLGLASFTVGWDLGNWLRENFETARLSGVAFVEATMSGLEYLRYAWESFSALVGDDTLEAATARHQERLQQNAAIFEQMYADAQSGAGEVIKAVDRMAASQGKAGEAGKGAGQQITDAQYEAKAALERTQAAIEAIDKSLKKVFQDGAESEKQALEIVKSFYEDREATAGQQSRTEAEREKTGTQLLIAESASRMKVVEDHAAKKLQLVEAAYKDELAKAQQGTDAQAALIRGSAEYRRQVWESLAGTYREVIASLVAEDQRHLANIRQIEEERAGLHRDTDSVIRDILQGTMDESEQFYDKQLEAADLTAKARKALADGDLKTAEAYSKSADQLNQDVAKTAASAYKTGEASAQSVNYFIGKFKEGRQLTDDILAAKNNAEQQQHAALQASIKDTQDGLGYVQTQIADIDKQLANPKLLQVALDGESFNAVQSAINALVSESATKVIDIVYREPGYAIGGPLPVQGLASGGVARKLKAGLISGPGTGTSDDITVNVSNGEHAFVTRASRAKTLWPLLNFLNFAPESDVAALVGALRLAAAGRGYDWGSGGPGFAGGGPIKGNGDGSASTSVTVSGGSDFWTRYESAARQHIEAVEQSLQGLLSHLTDAEQKALDYISAAYAETATRIDLSTSIQDKTAQTTQATLAAAESLRQSLNAIAIEHLKDLDRAEQDELQKAKTTGVKRKAVEQQFAQARQQIWIDTEAVYQKFIDSLSAKDQQYEAAAKQRLEEVGQALQASLSRSAETGKTILEAVASAFEDYRAKVNASLLPDAQKEALTTRSVLAEAAARQAALQDLARQRLRDVDAAYRQETRLAHVSADARAQIEEQSATARKQIWTDLLGEYQKTTDQLIAEDQRHVEAARRLEQERQDLQVGVENTLREIRRAGMSDEEVNQDRLKQAAEELGQARVARAKGDYEAAKRYAEDAAAIFADSAKQAAGDLKAGTGTQKDLDVLIGQYQTAAKLAENIVTAQQQAEESQHQALQAAIQDNVNGMADIQARIDAIDQSLADPKIVKTVVDVTSFEAVKDALAELTKPETKVITVQQVSGHALGGPLFVQGLASGGAPRKLKPGLISGPGTGTSDDITVKVSNGEHAFITREARARKVWPLLDYLNAAPEGEFSASLAKIKAAMAAPRFAEGGPISSLATLSPQAMAAPAPRVAGESISVTLKLGSGAATGAFPVVDSTRKLLADLKKAGLAAST